jgi:solute:Na+ symporter, SSS family
MTEVSSAPDLPTLAAFTVLLLSATAMALVAGRRSRQAPVGGEFTGWALAGRRHGTAMTWFLVGGSIFTAYTFVAVPALTYGVGALGFFAVPYVIVFFQLAYVVWPWLWERAAAHGWVTPADIVRGRFGSPWLALAVAATGILATMPYVALQLLGISSLLTAMGVPADGWAADLALLATFGVLAVASYRRGLQAPAAVSVMKAGAIFAAAGLLVVLVVRRPGGLPTVFETGAVDRPGFSLLLPEGSASAYISLAVGSAVALLLYPHVMLPVFAARSADVLRRVAPLLLGWGALLSALALVGLAAASQVSVPAGSAELAVPTLVRELLPPIPAGAVLGAIGVGALVPAAVMSVACAATFASNIYLEFVNPTAIPEQVTRVAQLVSVVVKLGAVAFVLGLRAEDAITLQLLGGVWILQTLPAVLLGLVARWPHRVALLAGLTAGVALGTWLVAAQGFVAVTELRMGGVEFGVYSGLVALAVNLVTVAVLTPLLDLAGVGRGPDVTMGGIPVPMRGEWEVPR